MENASVDALVVGAGLCGSWAAQELSIGGMKVALVDAGPLLPKSLFDFEVSRRLSPFSLRYHLFRIKLILKGQFDNAFNKFVTNETHKLFLDRSRHPYVTAEGRDFLWHRVRAVGGRGHFWGRVLLRMTDSQFSVPGFEWPLSYAELAPFYDEIERSLELGGSSSDYQDVCDGTYLHQRSLNLLEQQFRDAVVRRWPERRLIVNSIAGYQPSPLSPMLQRGLGTGNLDILPDTVVESLLFDRTGRTIEGARTIQTKTGERKNIRARYVILAASAFETVRLLLNSRSSAFPRGVGNSGGILGTRILEHVTASIFARLPDSARSRNPRFWHNPFKLNDEPHGFYMPPFWSSSNSSSKSDFGVQGTISSDTGLYYLGAFGAMVPSDENRLTVRPDITDSFGVPVAQIEFSWSDADLTMWRAANCSLREMTSAFSEDSGIRLREPGSNRLFKAISMGDAGLPPPGSNHESGGARMGRDPATSVVDPFNRVWDAPNVLVCDSACFPSLPRQNPTLTAMALAIRATRSLTSPAH